MSETLEKVNFTKQDGEAALMQKKLEILLAGGNPDEIEKALKAEPVLSADDIEIEEDEKPKKKKAKTKATREKKPEPKKEMPKIKFCEALAGLKNDGETFKVAFSQHDIPYKEQSWGIPFREVEYILRLVTQPKIARDCVEATKGNANDRSDAELGNIAYYEVVTYENVLPDAKKLGIIKVYLENGKIKTKTFTSNEKLKKLHINTDLFKTRLQREVVRVTR